MSSVSGKKAFIDPEYVAPETSARLSFSGGRLDRLSEERAEDCVERALAHPDALALAFVDGRVLVAFDEGGPYALMTPAEMEPFSPDLERAILLGYAMEFDGAPRLAIPLDIDPETAELPDEVKAVDFRSLAAQSLLSPHVLGQVAHGATWLAWHDSARFCGRCGGATELRAGGAKRHCSACGRDHFPRTDPVVIMMITAGDRCLLGRSPHFPPGMYSALAGFVEGGETLESAVRRESFEESGIHIGKVTYHASQPWPFPHSLMIGCYAEALDETIDYDAQELDDCRWFTREEIKEILAREGPSAADIAARIAAGGEGRKSDDSPVFLPPTLAIANRLITDWAQAG